MFCLDHLHQSHLCSCSCAVSWCSPQSLNQNLDIGMRSVDFIFIFNKLSRWLLCRIRFAIRTTGLGVEGTFLANDLIILSSVLTTTLSKHKIAVFYYQILCWTDIVTLAIWSQRWDKDINCAYSLAVLRSFTASWKYEGFFLEDYDRMSLASKLLHQNIFNKTSSISTIKALCCLPSML